MRDYIDFQDRTAPLAFLITFSCYGTRLHGDERGTHDRQSYNRLGTTNIPPTPYWVMRESSILKHPPIKLDSKMRPVVEEAIAEVCAYRGIMLIGIQARTNHVHSVVSAGESPEKLMGSFKEYATRALRENGLVARDSRVWARHGTQDISGPRNI